MARPRCRTVDQGQDFIHRYHYPRLLQRHSDMVGWGDGRPATANPTPVTEVMETVQIIGKKTPLTSKPGRACSASDSNRFPATSREEKFYGEYLSGDRKTFKRTHSYRSRSQKFSDGGQEAEKFTAFYQGRDISSTNRGTVESARPSLRRPYSSLSRWSRVSQPSGISVGSRVRSSSDGMDNDTTDLSSEVEEGRPQGQRSRTPGAKRPFSPVPRQANGAQSPITEDLIEREVYDKCRAWMATLPEKFCGLNNLLSIPADSSAYGPVGE